MKPRMRFLGYCPKCGKDVTADFCDECGAFTQEPEEDECHSTPTSVPKDTVGTKYGRIKGRKPRKNRVRSADKLDERSSRHR